MNSTCTNDRRAVRHGDKMYLFAVVLVKISKAVYPKNALSSLVCSLSLNKFHRQMSSQHSMRAYERDDVMNAKLILSPSRCLLIEINISRE